VKENPPKLSKKLRDEGFFEFAKNKAPGRCPVRGCRNPSRKDRALCHRHEQRRWRAHNPIKNYYNELKQRAKKRGHAFTISYDYFLGFCHATQFLEEHEGKVLTIERINASKGYVPGNIEALETSLNTAKGNRERWLSDEAREAIANRRRERAASLEEWCDEDDAPDVEVPEDYPF